MREVMLGRKAGRQQDGHVRAVRDIRARSHLTNRPDAASHLQGCFVGEWPRASGAFDETPNVTITANT